MNFPPSCRWERSQEWQRTDGRPFDAVVVGGGISGASIYSELRSRGLRTLLLERGDFACATSQASAMWAWGGLLYLSQLDFASVLRLSRARERLIRQQRGSVRPQAIQYLCRKRSRRHPCLVEAALYLYWLLGGGRRSKPRRIRPGSLPGFIDATRLGRCFEYQEAAIRPSDARFVLDRVLGEDPSDPASRPGRLDRSGAASGLLEGGPDCPAFNYCSLHSGLFEPGPSSWTLQARDHVLDRPVTVRCRQVICAAGVWTDAINRRFGVRTPFRHVPSKGVFLGIERRALGLSSGADGQATPPMVFDSGRNADTLALIPWGPLALWGPSESVVDDLSRGFEVEARDVEFLLDRWNRVSAVPLAAEDVVSLRCGVRPLAVGADQPVPDDTLGCSRRFRLHADARVPWLSVYGGKFTDAGLMARQAADLVQRRLKPGTQPVMLDDAHNQKAGRHPTGHHAGPEVSSAAVEAPFLNATRRSMGADLGSSAFAETSSGLDSAFGEAWPQSDPPGPPAPEMTSFPGLPGWFPSARWCRTREKCLTLEDYLRRRTNIGQWSPRGGLGRRDENFQHLVRLASAFCDGGPRQSALLVEEYRSQVESSLRCLTGAPAPARASVPAEPARRT